MAGRGQLAFGVKRMCLWAGLMAAMAGVAAILWQWR
jgi:hypothetical protein